MDRETLKECFKEKKVLYIEDDLETVEMMVHILENFFHEVIVGYNGAEGLELYNNNRVDYILSDVTMPVMDGLTLAESIKKNDPDAKLVFLTGHNEDEYIKRFKSLNALYISKPVNNKKLLQMLYELSC